MSGKPRDKATLEELERERWPEPTYDSHVVTECHRLRRVPLGDLTTENLRLLIGQNIGLAHLVPLAIERLREDPLAEGDFYPGDLLCAVLRVDPKFWASERKARAEVAEIAAQARGRAASQDEVIVRYIDKAMQTFAASSAGT